MKRFITTLLFIFCFLLSFVREELFLSLNCVLEHRACYGRYFNPEKFHSWPFSLVKFKWGLTIGFTILFGALTVLAISNHYNNKTFSRLTLFIYFFIIFVSGMIGFIGYTIIGFDKAYPFIRALIGIIHSPLILCFLFAAFYFLSRTQNNNSFL